MKQWQTRTLAADVDPRTLLRQIGLSGPLRVTALAANRGKGVWRVESAEGVHALRVLRPHEREVGRHERAAMEAARRAGIPVPDVRAHATLHGHPVMLLSWCNGRTVQDEIRARPWRAAHVGVICGRLQAMLHRVSAPPEVTAVAWEHRLGEIDAPLRVRLQAVAANRSRLLHGDFHPQNLVVTGNAVVGVLDWTNACGGDPRADLARSWALLVAYPRAQGVRSAANVLVRAMLYNGWRRGYEAVAGVQRDMLLFRIWAAQGMLTTLKREAAQYGRTVDLAPLERRVASLRLRAALPPATSLSDTVSE